MMKLPVESHEIGFSEGHLAATTDDLDCATEKKGELRALNS